MYDHELIKNLVNSMAPSLAEMHFMDFEGVILIEISLEILKNFDKLIIQIRFVGFLQFGNICGSYDKQSQKHHEVHQRNTHTIIKALEHILLALDICKS